jgi:hypothetical protein
MGRDRLRAGSGLVESRLPGLLLNANPFAPAALGEVAALPEGRPSFGRPGTSTGDPVTSPMNQPSGGNLAEVVHAFGAWEDRAARKNLKSVASQVPEHSLGRPSEFGTGPGRLPVGREVPLIWVLPGGTLSAWR